MLRDDFAVFILTHGRADNVVTADTLKRQKYSGKVYFIIDNEDDEAELYREKFGAENVIMFDKAAAVARADTMAALWPARTGDDYLDIITFQRGDKTALTKNFSLYEFECPCGCTAQMIDRELVEKMQALRDKLGKKVKVTSGYRCVKHNASKDVGGSKQSRHLYGIAADWRTDNRSVNPVALGILAQKAGFGGIGIYWHSKAAIVHTDTRGGKATWLCTSPGVYPSTTYNAFILPTIKQGCSGAANRSATIMLQKLLKVKADGSFGPGTTAALMDAQRKHGLVADGICGPKSWTALSGADKYM